MESQKMRQLEYHKGVVYSGLAPREADNSNPLVAWLNTYRLRKTLEMIGTSLSGKTVLSVCGGDGEEADYVSRQGADVSVTDLCITALEVARTRNPALRCFCMDAESLAFPDGAFDWAIVREGLHHLARPVKGLYELERVSRAGFAVMEGQDSPMVRLLVTLGLGDDRDPAGGYVYRFGRREIEKIFSAVQTIEKWEIHTAWLPYGSDLLKYFPVFKRFVYPIINHPLVLRILASKPGSRTLLFLFNLFNTLFGRWGNCLIGVAWKKPR
jgi:ubiquinone/menaquinone biosynthesis C-methylase UbiE